MTAARIATARLSAHPHALPLLAEWFRSEWPAWYGPGGPGDAEHDLRSYANHGGLPLGVVAFRDGALCGVAALKAASISSHAHLLPWAAAGFVLPAFRRQGIGAALLAAVALEAAALGYTRLYCATSTAASLLARAGWRRVDTARHDATELQIYARDI